MPVKAKLYIAVSIALGFALLAGTLIWFREFPDVARYLACLSLACIASTMKVRLPGLHGTISLNFVFILMALTQFSLVEALIVAGAATLVQCLWRTKTSPKLVQVLFNTSTVVISTALAFVGARLIPGQAHLLIALAPAATIFFVLNTGMISLVLALISDSTLVAIWKQCHLWAFPYYLVGAGMVALIGQASLTVGWKLSLLALPLLYLVYWCYKLYVSSHNERKTDVVTG
jgi:hypothetical protein